MPGFGSRAPHLETRPSASVCVITLKEPLQAPCLYTTESPRKILQSASLARFPPAARMQANSQRAEKSWTSPPWGQLTDLTRWSQSKKARPCKFWNSKKLTYERPVRTGNSKNRAQTSTWRRQHAPQRPLSSQAARDRPNLTSWAAASAHPGQLPAVGAARARSPGHRRPRLEGPGRENRAAG